MSEWTRRTAVFLTGAVCDGGSTCGKTESIWSSYRIIIVTLTNS